MQLLSKLLLVSFLSLPVFKGELNDRIDIFFQESPVYSYSKNGLFFKELDEPLPDPIMIETIVDEVDKKISVLPHDAYLNDENTIVQQENGYSVHRKKLKKQLVQALFTKGNAKIDIPLKIDYPRVDSELLSSIRAKQIGHYVTYFNNLNNERSNNIKLAAAKINNTVVFPGEKFSFNKVVGKRTKEKGYMKAPVIVKGELSEDIGGGICQVSSTLYNAVDFAGVQIVERYHHSKRVPYVPEGRDATVSWYGPDFSFRNTYTHPLLIRARIDGGQLMVTVHSSELVTVKKRDVPPSSKHLPPEFRKDEH
ncbi:VanW family protein [Rossellomorea aquimaris]|uniref:VanW family protein n=1 Tax=Rossellomorea aquimaris TaxID=189382 RepID=UPI001CD431E0|nr:VanW family protein [Rossellomorea aquimaris]MCA1053610.1 VanW family protein [Rossellomorea aquimaris]